MTHQVVFQLWQLRRWDPSLPPAAPGCVTVLIQWRQTNVVIDQMHRARLTEYGLASINSDPRFAARISRWPAPEIIDFSCDGDGTPVTESKFADVFAFAMFAVEVFTDKAPFDGQPPAKVVLCIQSGERPEMPGDAQGAGLTVKVWRLLESCWQQDPKKRPTMKEVVRRWRRFAEYKNNDDTTTRCVQTTLVILASEIPFSTLYDWFRGSKAETGPAPTTSNLRAGASRPQTKSKASRFRTSPEPIHPQPSESLFPGGYQSQVMIYRCRSIEATEEIDLWIALISWSWRQDHPYTRIAVSPRIVYRYCGLEHHRFAKGGKSAPHDSVARERFNVFLT